MFKEFFLAFCLISFSSQTYAPWHLRNFDYSVSDICYYSDGSFQYVKPCQTNYACSTVGSNSHYIKTCRQFFKTVKTFGKECTGDIECDSGLKCDSQTKKCRNEHDEDIYTIDDKIASDYAVYHCNTDYVAKISIDPITNAETYSCISKNDATVKDVGDNCYMDVRSDGTTTVKIVPPKFGYVCGKKHWPDLGSNTYYHSRTEMNKIGSLPDGEYVEDMMACESGFALPLYHDKSLKPSFTGDNKDWVCVTFKEVGSDKNDKTVFKYSLNNNEFSYDTQGVRTDADLIPVQLELFKEYVSKAGSLNCAQGGDYDNEQFTCGNDDLRRLWYFYHNPKEYLLYKNEDAIVDYLLQTKYPDYKPRYTEPQQEASSYLSIKYISLLILLLSL